jgi:hypothetical protein
MTTKKTDRSASAAQEAAATLADRLRASGADATLHDASGRATREAREAVTLRLRAKATTPPSRRVPEGERPTTALRSEFEHHPVTVGQHRRYRLGPLRQSLDRFAGEVLVENLWFVKPLGGGWIAWFRLAPRPRRVPMITEVRVIPLEARPLPGGEWMAALKGRRARLPHTPLTTRRFRGASPTEALPLIREHLARLAGPVLRRGFFIGTPAPTPVHDTKGPGRARYPRLHYARVAARYVALEETRGSRRDSTLKTLAREYDVSYMTVVGWVRTARRLGFLTKLAKGRRGGKLTEAAERVLNHKGESA